MNPEPGHLFIVRGDLTKLACDAYVLPCDHRHRVAPYWAPLLPPLQETRPWPTVPDVELEGHLAEVREAPLKVIVVDTVSHATAAAMVDAVVTAVRACAGIGRTRLHTRRPHAMPLIGLPLPGTGEGIFREARGEVSQKLIEQLNDLVIGLGADVALVLKDARDYAFAQAVRRDALSIVDWKALGPRGSELAAEADELGAAAGRGELSLFVGAGASLPLGLPAWEELVTSLERAVGESTHGDVYQRAANARKRDPARYAEVLRRTFPVKQHAIGHALLANLGTGRVVTTNYDNALELALAGDQGEGTFRVMTREVPDGGRPWLLKLHGDIARPDTIVLTDQDYARLKERSSALYGVIGTLMLTSKLVFVGFSLTDRDFQAVAEDVQKILTQADQGPELLSGHAYRISAPVALALVPDAVKAGPGIRVFATGDEDDKEMAARRLEVMLDRVALRAAELSATSATYLLDDRYRIANADSASLIERLKSVAELVNHNRSEGSATWREVKKALVALGLEDS